MSRPNRSDVRHEVEDLLRNNNVEDVEMLADEIAGNEGVFQTWEALNTVNVQLEHSVKDEIGIRAATHLETARDALRDAFYRAVMEAVDE